MNEDNKAPSYSTEANGKKLKRGNLYFTIRYSFMFDSIDIPENVLADEKALEKWIKRNIKIAFNADYKLGYIPDKSVTRINVVKPLEKTINP